MDYISWTDTHTHRRDEMAAKILIRYETPLGCFKTWEDAARALERCDMDPCECINIVASPTDVFYETAYGVTTRLWYGIRVF